MALTIEEYSRRQAAISRRVIAAVLRLLSPFRRQGLSTKQLQALFAQLHTMIEDARWESATLGREYFDAEWRRHQPDEPPPVMLPGYRRPVFNAALRPVIRQLRGADTSREVIAQTALIAAKEAHNGARLTTIRAVNESSGRVLWARYDPEPPTCAWCLMLISRGPVYSENTGTYKTPKTRTYSGDDREKWHTGCTCEAIAVHDEATWPGRAQQLNAEALWKDSTKGYRGQDAINAFRRAVYARNRRAASTDEAAAA